MERLTKRTDGKVAFCECVDTCRTCNGVQCGNIFTMVERLSAYEDTGYTPEEIEHILDEYGRGMTLRTSNAERLEIVKDIPTSKLKLIFQKNDPLTLEELREMNGKPVYIVGRRIGNYDIYCGYAINGIAQFYKAALPFNEYGHGWLAYRRKPEEETA